MRPRVVTYVDSAGRVRAERSNVVPTTPCGKRGYSSKKIAKAKAITSSRVSGEAIEAYRCWRKGCHCWHIGHRPEPYDRAIALGEKPSRAERKVS